MIVLDANYFLRYLTRPVTPQDQAMFAQAQTLFRLARTGALEFTTSEAVVAEVVFILHSPRQYNTSRADVTGRVKQLLRLRGCKLPSKGRVSRALDLWASTPTISFVETLAATMALDLHADLGSFDRRLGRVPGITLWQAPSSEEGQTDASNGTT